MSLLEYRGKLAQLGSYKRGQESADITKKKEVGEGALPAPPDRAWVTVFFVKESAKAC